MLKPSSPLPGRVLSQRAWILVALTVLFVLAVRVRLREMPLERDEGEYAYAGQLLLQGVPPYKEAYNMKLPGTYAAYAVIMAVFGQSASGIHLGLALVNAGSVALIFLIGRTLLDEAAGVAAAIAYALMSLSPSVLGLAGHATHFVVLAALGGILLLLRAAPPSPGLEGAGWMKGREKLLFGSGLLFGLAFLMKQHGIFFGVFGGLYLVWPKVKEQWEGKTNTSKRPLFRPLFPSEFKRVNRTPGRGARQPDPSPITLSPAVAGWGTIIRELGLFAGGLLLPYGLTCLALWSAGAFHQFIFWTVSYAAQYASAIPLVNGPELLRTGLDAVVGPNLLLWVLPWVGGVLMWWEDRLKLDYRFLIASLLVCSVASVSVGLLFRAHYFITLLPVLALLTGIAVSRGLHLLAHDLTIELFLAVPILGLFLIGALAAIIGNGSVWFAMTPEEAMRDTYGTTLFSEARNAADYIKKNSASHARIAVVGSEPEIYFYSRRRSATGYIYTYPLVEAHPYASRMREEMIAEIERARPEYVIFVNVGLSWATGPAAGRRMHDWFQSYWAANLDLASTINIEGKHEETPDLNPEEARYLYDGSKAAPELKIAPARESLLILKRKGG